MLSTVKRMTRLNQERNTLRFVFGQCALQALDLVDQRSVTCVSSPSGRKAFQVGVNKCLCLFSFHTAPEQNIFSSCLAVNDV
uniref:Uncharacterized protein n=1 Tax=Sinocyclocheilus grahami TaxID=75366 RepID=A0A672KPP7_SINGR